MKLKFQPKPIYVDPKLKALAKDVALQVAASLTVAVAVKVIMIAGAAVVTAVMAKEE